MAKIRGPSVLRGKTHVTCRASLEKPCVVKYPETLPGKSSWRAGKVASKKEMHPGTG